MMPCTDVCSICPLLTLRAGAKFGAGRAGKPPALRDITLRHLIGEGLVSPGDNVLSLTYKDHTTSATLLPDGSISCLVSRPLPACPVKVEASPCRL